LAVSPSGPGGGGGGGGGGGDRGGLFAEFEFHLTVLHPGAARIAINVDPVPSQLTGLGGKRSAVRATCVCALGRYRGGRMRMIGVGEEWE
jgi:hypothetical protein